MFRQRTLGMMLEGKLLLSSFTGALKQEAEVAAAADRIRAGS
jgi:hypothetical protein